jgi:hypothetical protein
MIYKIFPAGSQLSPCITHTRAFLFEINRFTDLRKLAACLKNFLPLPMLLPQIINEIKILKTQPTHRSCLTVFNLLENNKNMFLQKMEPDNFNHVYNAFEGLSQSSPKEYNTDDYRAEYEKAHSLLMFYLDRII